MIEDVLKNEEVIFTKSGKVRKRKPKKPVDYFTLETQQAILEFRQETCEKKRNEIFNGKIHYAFYKLAENIIHTFKFHYTEVDDIEDLKHEVITVLLQKLHRYDESLGKAYSYFGTITKRYLIVYNNNNYKRLKAKAPVEDVETDKTITNDLILNQKDDIVEVNFIELYIKRLSEDIDKLFTKQQEIRVADAILELFKRRENIEIFNKKALFIYIKEMTDAPTPVITKVIKVLKQIYKDMLNEHLEKGSELDIFSR